MVLTLQDVQSALKLQTATKLDAPQGVIVTVVVAEETPVVDKVTATRAVVKTEGVAVTTGVPAVVTQVIAIALVIVEETAPVHRTDLREAVIQQLRVFLDQRKRLPRITKT